MRIYFIFGLFFHLMFGGLFQAIAQEQWQEEYSVSEAETMGQRNFLSLDFNCSIPVSQTRNYLTKSVLGAHLNYLYQVFPKRPVFIGMGISFGQYDQASLEYFDFVEIDEYLFRKTTHFYVMSFEPKARYFPGLPFWRVEPFIELGMALRDSYGFTQVLNVDLDESSLPRLVKGNWTLGYTVGMGGLVDIGLVNEGVFGQILISYGSGPNSFFYLKKKEGVTGYEEPIDRYIRRSIPFNYLTINIGITGYF